MPLPIQFGWLWNQYESINQIKSIRFSFDTTSSSDDINVYETEISLSQIPEGQDIKIYLGNDSGCIQSFFLMKCI